LTDRNIEGNKASETPVLILKRSLLGEEVKHSNIMAARIIAETVRSSLGPKGMDKMLIDSFGDVTITSDGRMILDEMDIQHPAAKMMLEVARSQDETVGEGTTTAVVMAGELLGKAERLLDQNIQSTAIISGYEKAVQKALETLEKASIPTRIDDLATFRKVAMTSIASKVVAEHKEYLADVTVQAIFAVAEKDSDGFNIDLDNVKVEKKLGRSVRETQLVHGIALEKEVAHDRMPKHIDNARIALLDCLLEIEKTEMSAETRIKDPERMKAFLDQETTMLRGMVDKVKASGANVVFCQKGIGDMALHFLAKEGILAARRVKKSDMEKLAKASGGKIVTNLGGITSADLGCAALVEERKIGEDKMTFIEGCKNPKTVTVLIRGESQRIIDEAERSVYDAMFVVKDVIEEPKIVAGGGAAESEIAEALREYAAKQTGNERLVIEAFADSVETVPIALAENAGLDAIDLVCELRASHKSGGVFDGIDVLIGKIGNMKERGILEPLLVKKQTLKSSLEAAKMILKLDDVIAGGGVKTPSTSLKEPREAFSAPNLSKELRNKNWIFFVPLIEETISMLEAKTKAPDSFDSFLEATIDAEKGMKSDIDRDLMTALRTHLVHAHAFAEVGIKNRPRALEEAREHLDRILELLKVANEVDKMAEKLGLRRLEAEDLRKIDEIEGRSVYTTRKPRDRACKKG